MMWEESTFQNRREIRQDGQPGTGVGFGQVNETEYWRWNKSNKKEYMFDAKEQMRDRVLQSESLSVRIVGMMLADLQRRLPRATWGQILQNYAGVSTNPKNQKAVNQWNAAYPLLRDPQRTVRLPQGYWIPPISAIKAALTAAKPNGVGFIDETLSDIS